MWLIEQTVSKLYVNASYNKVLDGTRDVTKMILMVAGCGKGYQENSGMRFTDGDNEVVSLLFEEFKE